MLDERQLFAISVAERVCSAISLISASIAVLTFLSTAAFRKPPINRLIFYALWGNIGLNISTLISQSGLEHGTGSFLCQFQAFLVQWLFPADAVWALCIARNVHLILFYHYNLEQLRRLEWRYVLLCYCLPLIPAFTLLFIQSPGRGKIYGPAVFQCWISLPWNTLRIAIFYGPVWLTIIVTFAIYIRVGLHIYSQLKQLRGLGMAGVGTGNVNQTDTSFTKRYDMRPATSCSYQNDNWTNQNGHSGASEPVSMRSNSNIATWAFARYAFVFFIRLLITWVPSSINRLSTLIDPQYLSFGLNYAAALVIPLQGFWNSIIYVIISRKEFNALFRKLRETTCKK